jgi:hypothetical protein
MKRIMSAKEKENSVIHEPAQNVRNAGDLLERYTFGCLRDFKWFYFISESQHRMSGS